MERVKLSLLLLLVVHVDYLVTVVSSTAQAAGETGLPSQRSGAKEEYDSASHMYTEWL